MSKLVYQNVDPILDSLLSPTSRANTNSLRCLMTYFGWNVWSRVVQKHRKESKWKLNNKEKNTHSPTNSTYQRPRQTNQHQQRLDPEKIKITVTTIKMRETIQTNNQREITIRKFEGNVPRTMKRCYKDTKILHCRQRHIQRTMLNVLTD